MPAVKPDPPLNVTVEALEKAPQRLRVTWTYPSSWDPRFYWLRFQVRYRPEPTPTFTEVSPHPERSRTLGPLGLPPPPPGSHRPCPRQVDQVTRTWLDIRDAWRGTRHLVQVRAQEEFGHGAWSEWSHEAVGTPWTGTGGDVDVRAPTQAVLRSHGPLTLQTPGTSPRWGPTARR